MPRLAQAEEWRAVRDLRLEALSNAPEAFEVTLAQAEHSTDEEWRQQVVPRDERLTFVEENEDGDLVGMAVGLFDPAAGIAYLVGMFVEPASRGSGLGRGLMEAVESWAREVDAIRVALEVNPDLVPAVRLYEGCGYERTGRSRVLPLVPTEGDRGVQDVGVTASLEPVPVHSQKAIRVLSTCHVWAGAD